MMGFDDRVLRLRITNSQNIFKPLPLEINISLILFVGVYGIYPFDIVRGGNWNGIFNSCQFRLEIL